MDPRSIIENAKRDGTIWLGGEMEIPYPCLFHEAYQIAANIAEQCGYLVTTKGTRSQLFIVGGDILGEILLDWFDGERQGPEKVALWTEQAAYFTQ